jgi:hypothetical protein
VVWADMGCDHAAFAMVVPFCMPDCFTDATNSDNGTAGERGGRPSPQLATAQVVPATVVVRLFESDVHVTPPQPLPSLE